MNFIIKPSTLKGDTYIPASKSHTIRSVFISSLANGKSTIKNPLCSEDGISSVKACKALGSKIEMGEDWVVTGTGGKIISEDGTIDVGNSGTTATFVTSMAALGENDFTITGDNQTSARPMEPLIKALNNLGANIVSLGNNGRLPIRVRGKLKGGSTEVSGVTSQFLSSLLIHCPLAENDSEIFVSDLNERPYAEMTLRWLDSQKIIYENHNFERFFIKKNQVYSPIDINVPSDFSSATFFLCAGAITESDILLKGLDMQDSQGDKKVVTFLKEMGAVINLTTEGIRVRGGNLKGLEIDMNETPDALPAMAVVGCFASGTTVLRNVPQARLKETDRISVMYRELKKMGAKIDELPDGLRISESPLTGTLVDGHGDHRVVMSLVVAGLRAKNSTTVQGSEAVNITFPTFQTTMNALGANLEASK